VALTPVLIVHSVGLGTPADQSVAVSCSPHSGTHLPVYLHIACILSTSAAPAMSQRVRRRDRFVGIFRSLSDRNAPTIPSSPTVQVCASRLRTSATLHGAVTGT
jgi:hypothetical protein